jgi:hypothetical protein
MLIRECGQSSLTRRNLPRTFIVNHINHICFWTASSMTAILVAFSMSRAVTTTAIPAMLITLPLYVAMLIQTSLWCVKDRHYACSFQVPDGFPIDPIHLTALFIAARVDQYIMWDWGLVFWCPWCLFALAVYNTLVYAIVTSDVVIVHRRESTLPIQEQTYAMSFDNNRYVRPIWLGMRNFVRFLMAFVTTICLWFVLHYSTLRLNGDTEQYSLLMVIVPLEILFLFNGFSILVTSCYINKHLIQHEPHRCGYCDEPIVMMLQIDPSRARAISDEAADTVNIIRYEDPNDNLERDVDMMLNDDGDRIIHYTHGSPMDSTASIEIPTELIRRAGQAMWNPSWRSSGKGGGGSGGGSSSTMGETKKNYVENEKCTICRDRAPDCVFLSCGHSTQCWECARRVIHAKNRHRHQNNNTNRDSDSGDAI